MQKSDCRSISSYQSSYHFVNTSHPEIYQSVEFCEEKPEQIIRLKMEINAKDQELKQKDQIIRNLQERCVVIQEYEEKVKRLEEKAKVLERIIEGWEKREGSNIIKSTNINVSIKNQNQENNKSNQQTLLFGQKNEEIISSKFLSPNNNGKQSINQIDLKFNQIRSLIHEQKPKSNKNIQQILSIVNHKKHQKGQSVLKQINTRLQSIIKQSAKSNITLTEPVFKKHKRSETFCTVLDSSFSINSNSTTQGERYNRNSIHNQKSNYLKPKFQLNLNSLKQNFKPSSRKQKIEMILNATNIDKKIRPENQIKFQVQKRNVRYSYNPIMTDRISKKSYWE